MDHDKQQRADVAIKAFRTQVRLLAAAVASLSAGVERATTVKADGPEILDLGALAERLDNVSPMLAVLAEEVRQKAVAAFGNPLPSKNAAPATVHTVRNSLQMVTIGVAILQQQLAKLEVAQDSAQGTALLGNDLDLLDAEAQAMGSELTNWSREIGAGLAG